MTPYSHDSSNRITSIGGGVSAKPMTVRGSTSEPAKVKAKTAASATWKNARMLDGNRFEADLDVSSGSNTLLLEARDASNNISAYSYTLGVAAATSAAPNYDADGNMLTDGTYTYQWDSQSRLTKIIWGAGSNKTTEFKYNALGQRSQVIETAPGYSPNYTFYLYDGIHLLDRRTGNSSPNSATIDRRYFSQGEQRKNATAWDSFYYTRDHLGSIREVVKSDGTLQARYDYDPYGKRSACYVASTYSGGCDFGFTGHITIAPGSTSTGPEIVLTHFRAYSPDLRRWLSADPLGEAGGMNLYTYCYGNERGQ